MKKLAISIPKPCHESWANMTPTERGRFCDQCTKEVTDYSQLSDVELFKAIKANPNGCGRFKISQIETPISIRHNDRHWKKIAAFLFPILLGSASLQGQQQVKKERIQLIEKQLVSTVATNDKPSKIKGIVTDTNQEPLIGVTVLIEGTDMGTVTDIDGTFELERSNNKVTTTIIFSYVGMESKTMRVSTKQSSLKVQLTEAEALIGEVVVVGYGIVKKQTKMGYYTTPQTLVGVIRHWRKKAQWKRAQKSESNRGKISNKLSYSIDNTPVTGIPENKSTNLICRQKNLQVSPNPFKQFLKIEFTSPTDQNIRLELVNNLGQILAKQQPYVNQGFHSFDWEINELSLSSGVYYLRLIQQNGEQETVTLLAQ
ncbi:MAG: carboxypeptidase-like regulatory domain-containing protein [Bacteroidota bacterium]